MKKKLLYSILSCTYSIGICYSQDLLWEKSFGGKHAEHFTDMIPTADYGFIIGGSSFSSASGDKTNASKGDLDFWIWKMDEHGSMEWQKSFGGNGTDILKTVLATRDGGYLLAGTTNSSKGADKKEESFGGTDIWIIKLNATGVEEWQITLGGDQNEELAKVIESKNGDLLVCSSSNSGVSGSKESTNKGGSDYWLVSLDRKGTINWQKSIGGNGADIMRTATITPDNGYLIGGYSNSEATDEIIGSHKGNGDFLIYKLDSLGNEQWQERYGGDQEDQIYSIVSLNQGGYLLAGNSYSSSSHNKRTSNKKGSDIWLIQIDELGTIQWQESYNIDEDDILMSVIQNNDGSFIIGGYSAANHPSHSKKTNKNEIDDFVIIKIDQQGDEKWRKSIGSNGTDVLKQIIELRDGSYLLGGTTEGEISKNRNSWKGQKDIWIVKLQDKEKEKDPRFKIEAFPNPTTEFTNVVITYDYNTGNATLYDLQGRIINSQKINGERTLPFNLSGLPQGMYLIDIETNISKDAVKILKN